MKQFSYFSKTRVAQIRKFSKLNGIISYLFLWLYTFCSLRFTIWHSNVNRKCVSNVKDFFYKGSTTSVRLSPKSSSSIFSYNLNAAEDLCRVVLIDANRLWTKRKLTLSRKRRNPMRNMFFLAWSGPIWIMFQMRTVCMSATFIAKLRGKIFQFIIVFTSQPLKSLVECLFYIVVRMPYWKEWDLNILKQTPHYQTLDVCKGRLFFVFMSTVVNLSIKFKRQPL